MNEYLYELSETRTDLLGLPTGIKNFIDGLAGRITEGDILHSDYWKWNGYRNWKHGNKAQIMLVIRLGLILKEYSNLNGFNDEYHGMQLRSFEFLGEYSNLPFYFLMLQVENVMEVIPGLLSKSAKEALFSIYDDFQKMLCVFEQIIKEVYGWEIDDLNQNVVWFMGRTFLNANFGEHMDPIIFLSRNRIYMQMAIDIKLRNWKQDICYPVIEKALWTFSEMMNQKIETAKEKK